jgi:phosphomannomutase
VSLRFDDVSAMAPLVASLRAAPPATLAGVAVTQDNPAPDIVRLRGEGVRVVIRPSGTEPKVKAYLEVVAPVTTDVASARASAGSRLASLREEVTTLLKA